MSPAAWLGISRGSGICHSPGALAWYKRQHMALMIGPMQCRHTYYLPAPACRSTSSCAVIHSASKSLAAAQQWHGTPLPHAHVHLLLNGKPSYRTFSVPYSKSPATCRLLPTGGPHRMLLLSPTRSLAAAKWPHWPSTPGARDAIAAGGQPPYRIFLYYVHYHLLLVFSLPTG